ncbi:MAG: tripartite tricarboxylate transporter substrate binding protein [Burkholderiales bacterium]|jgi:tripartite-type tricarboxylate transporter receptor subunit TctC|nr:tripartite tricarboxylate transporter substrate binding protein [Burkholderiales bacterium]
MTPDHPSSALRRVGLWRIAAGLLAAIALQAHAAFPERPITIVVPFSAGGGTDLTARLLARSMEKHGGQSVVVVNRTGAGGEIGMASVAAAPADGYTLSIINTPNTLTIPIERAAKFRLESFDLLANVVDDPATLSVNSTSGIRTVQDLVAAAKKSPDTLTYGTAGIGSAGHISMLLLEKAAGIKLRHVPFKGTSDVATALLGNHIDVATANLGEALAFSKGKDWRILGQMAPRRSPMARDLPTFAEAGYALESGSLRGIGAPRGLPPATASALQALIDKAVNDPEFQSAALKAEQDVRYLRAPEYTALMTEMKKRFESLWTTSPWSP